MEGEGSPAARHYARVRTEHGDESDPFGALRDCERLIAAHPDSPEAGASHDWMQRLRRLRVRLADGTLVAVGDLMARRERPTAGGAAR
jgi:hypothetical protein